MALACLVAIGAAVWVTGETQTKLADHAAAERQALAASKAYDQAAKQSSAVDKEVADMKAEIASRQPAARPRPRSQSPSQQVRLKTAEIIREKPELMAAAREASQRRIDRAYDALFRQLNLSPEQIRSFEEILAAESGLVANGYVLQAPADNGAEMTRQKLEALLGGNYETYQQYRNSLYERSQVEQFAGAVAGVEPLTATATQQLLQLFSAAHAKERQALHAQGGGSYGSAEIYGDIVPAAQSVLTPRQFKVLQLMAARDAGVEIDGP
jgi:hypothetical protein